MTKSGTPEPDPRGLYEDAAAAQLAAVDTRFPGADTVRWRGSLIPSVAVVKGLPGPAEVSGGDAVSGADGAAVAKALEALGHDPSQVFYTLSRPEVSIPAERRAERIREQIEAVDAPLVLAIDAAAAEDVRAAFGIAALPFGALVRAHGRRFVACEGLEASLGDERMKRRVWRQMSAATPHPPAF